MDFFDLNDQLRRESGVESINVPSQIEREVIRAKQINMRSKIWQRRNPRVFPTDEIRVQVNMEQSTFEDQIFRVFNIIPDPRRVRNR